MNHWETAGRMAAEHRADLDREAVGVGLAAALAKGGRPTSRRTWHSVVAGRFQSLRTRFAFSGPADNPTADLSELPVEV
jgi:hypothetical protein